MWSREDVIRELVGSVAIAVQRGGAMTYLEGYDKALHAMRAHRRHAAKGGVGEHEEWTESEEE